MRALVTGGGGFLGAALVRELARRGWPVRAFARGDSGVPATTTCCRGSSHARAGRLRRIGKRDTLVDTIFVDNCVHAHVLAAEQLAKGAGASGRAYFVSDGAPVGVWTMANRMLDCAGVPPVTRSVPAWAAYAVGATLEATHALFRIEREPAMTRFGAPPLAQAPWFDIEAARRDLGYSPVVTIEQGLARLAVWCRAATSIAAR